MDVKEVEACLQYHDAKERDVVKQYFTNPSSIDRSKKTIVFSTPLISGGFQK